MDNTNNTHSYRDNCSNSSKDYLERAARAVDKGDKTLGIHLYLAAFERAVHENLVPSNDSLEGMEAAWKLAVDTRQRSLAEHIFEKLEPFWSPEEMAQHADQLQRLALDKLEEFGLTREAIEDMAEMVNQDLMGITPDILCHFENAENTDAQPLLPTNTAADNQEGQDASKDNHAVSASDSSPIQLPGTPLSFPEKLAALASNKMAENASSKSPETSQAPGEKVSDPMPHEQMNYRSVVGFESVISQMAKLGIGRSDDPQFQSFIAQLNQRHGLSQMPSLGTIVFSSEAREDANYFMLATVGEMGLPAVRMRMDTNIHGQPVLYVMASADMRQRMTAFARGNFDLPAVLVLEDLDLWDLPLFDGSAGSQQGLIQMQVSRGAREALALIQTAFDTPEVTVFISATNPEAIDERFSDALGIHRIIPIALPDAAERQAVWNEAQRMHPSLGGLNVSKLMEYSKGLSRFDIFSVASEAVDRAYRESLEAGEFRAVDEDDVLVRLSTFFPLESDEYRRMEDEVANHFAQSNLDDLLNA